MISLSVIITFLLSIVVSASSSVSANPIPMNSDSETAIDPAFEQIQAVVSEPNVRLVEDFNGGNLSANFIKASGKLEFASRPEPVIYGSQSAKLSYNLISQETGTAAAYVNFLDPGTSNFRTLEGKPTKLGLWVYGDGNNKHWLRAEFNTTADVSDFTSTAGFDWKGWKYVTINIPARLTNSNFTDPIKLRRIYFVQTNELNKTAGTAYFDRVSVFYGDTGGLYGVDLLGLTPMKTGDVQTAQVFETREGYTAPKKVDGGVSFTSSNESVASVDEQGNVTALSGGATTITASYGALNATYELVVSDEGPVMEQLYFTGDSELRAGEKAQTDLFASFKDVSESIRILSGATYISENEQIATIDANGLIEAMGIGRTVVSATYGNLSSSIELGVEMPIPILQSIELSGLAPIEIGGSKQAKVLATYNTGTEKVELQEGVTFTSSTPNVASVDGNGFIQGLSLGVSLITAKYEGKSAFYTIVVNKPGLQPPKRELRAAWISTVENIDWPKTKDPEQQKQDYIDLLDFHQSIGMNALVMQVKPTADAFYKSELAPWSHWITGVQGQDPGYDPLAFMVEEAHKRNLEFHAWFNPYRISMNTDLSKLVEDHPARLHPEWVMEYGGKLYYNPGIPEVIQYITDSVMEVVKNYDIDGVHFDDYFYPNRFDGEGFPDQQAYELYGADYPGDINAWRRNNVDTLIKKLNEAIKAEKSYVKFGISPFGVWRNKSVDPAGSDTNAGQPSYDNLHADVRKWVLEGWIDYVTPQIYWNFGFAPAAYEKLVEWWSDLIEENDANAHLYIGHADYKVDDNPNFVDPYEIPNQMKFNLNYEQVKGSIHFTTRDLIAKTELRQKIMDVYQHQSLVPAMPWLDAEAPEKPSMTKATPQASRIELNWKDDDNSTAYYVIYRSVGDQAIDTGNPAHIAATVRKSNGQLSYIDQQVTQGETYTYIVTAVDRLHNESEASNAMTIKAEEGVEEPLLVEATEEWSDLSVVYGTKLEDLKLPQEVQITLSDSSTWEVKVTWNNGSPAYNGTIAGKYSFIGELELPEGVLNPDGIQSTINVTVQASGNGGGNGGGGGTSVEPPTSITSSLKAGGSGTVKLGEEISVYIPEGATDQELRLTIEKMKNNSGLQLSSGHKLISSVFEILKNFKANFKKSVTITITFDSSKVGNNQKPSLFYFDENQKKWIEIGGTVKDGKLVAQVDHFTKFAVFAVDNKAPSSCADVQVTDITGHWAEKQVTEAIQQCIVNGYPDHTFLPDQTISREEFAVMLVHALQLEGEAAATTFSDQDQISMWAQSSVALAVKAGIITGYEDDSFRPQAKISRAEITAMFVRALQLKEQANAQNSFVDDADIPAWAKGYVSIAVEKGIILGREGNRFAPNAPATRAESVVMLLRMLDTLN